MLKAVLFDMDGVIFDTEAVIAKAAILCLNEYGISPVPEDFVPFIGTGERSFIGGVAAKYGLDYQPEMITRTYEIYDTIAQEITIFPGVIGSIEYVRGCGLKAAVCSSAHRRKVLTNLRVKSVSESLFDAMVTAEDVVNKKPDPAVFLMGAARLNVPPASCLVIEDALAGIAAGKAAGCTVAAVPTSFPREDLARAGADFVLKDIAALPALLQQLLR